MRMFQSVSGHSSEHTIHKKISTTQEEVEDILLRLNVHKASGVDGIPARILKIYAKELSGPLTYLFNLSFTLGEVPLIWKRANITPVFKANARENVENYRSISLLSILSKCQERIVHRVVYSHVSPFLNGWQHGFVKGRSCITQLVLTHHMWHKALDDGLQVDAVFLDFTKAFDRVHHKILLNKLCNFGISGSLLEWCSDYLSNRTQRVVIDGNCSSWLNIPSGVPQGSILGPLFFFIFISDLPEVVSVGNTLAMYADDCKAFSVMSCPNDQLMFQEDLGRLCTWSERNRMDFNVKKCKLMRITMKKQPFISNFTLKGSVLEEVNEFRDLGLLTNHHLSWNSHIDTITSKANRILGLIKRTCRGWKDTETLKTLYCTLVRSQVEYGSVVWSPYTSRNIDKLERIQWRGTKFILGQNDISYEDRLKCLNMLSLEKRRYLFDVVFLYKVLNGYLNIELTPLLNFYSKADPYKFRHVDDYSLKRNYARTTKFKNSYFNRIVEMWNSLPLEIRLAPNLEAFKSKVKKFIT